MKQTNTEALKLTPVNLSFVVNHLKGQGLRVTTVKESEEKPPAKMELDELKVPIPHLVIMEGLSYPALQVLVQQAHDRTMLYLQAREKAKVTRVIQLVGD